MSAGRAKKAGDEGEALAAQFLEDQGCTILARQWRCRYGELDLVARKGEAIRFVEVKRRGPGAIGLPREFVDERKRDRLRKAAAAYLAEHDPDAFAQFDVAEIYEEPDGRFRVEYLEAAFE
ncbi:MAG: YraN family protein [Oscillibacter sp.]|nr:YraN family protein [Oscillibacter sp.]